MTTTFPRDAAEKIGVRTFPIDESTTSAETPTIPISWIGAAAKTGAAIPAAPVTATIKKAKDSVIVETVDRSDLFEAQTPQIFDRALLQKAYANLANVDQSTISDDAQLVEALGEKVSIVETDSSNIKITKPSDIPIAEAIVKSRPKPKADGYEGPFIEAQW